MSFDAAKADILGKLGVVDYSPKGSVDVEIVPLVNLVNTHRDLVTTSSCAGRLSIFIEGSKKNRIGGKGDGGHWLFFTHNKNEVNSGWPQGLERYQHPVQVNAMEPRRYVLYKFEPFILHVKCRDFNASRALFTAALACGFRESGIGPNNIVAIRISMRIDAPLGYLEGDRIKVIVDNEYIDHLNRLALELFDKNEGRIEQLRQKIEGLIEASEVNEVCESKEERRVRKRKEGLERAVQREERGEREEKEEKEIEYGGW